MSILDEQAMEDMSHLALERCLSSLQSVLQLIPDPHQRTVVASGIGSMVIAIVTVMLKEHYVLDTGAEIPFEEALAVVGIRILKGSLDVGEDMTTLAIAKMQSRTIN